MSCFRYIHWRSFKGHHSKAMNQAKDNNHYVNYCVSMIPKCARHIKIIQNQHPNKQIDQVSTLTRWKRWHLKFQPSFIRHEPMALWHDILSYIDLTSLAMSCDVKVQHSWLERINRQLHFFWPDVHLGISGTLPGTACCQTQICHTSNNDPDPLLLHIGSAGEVTRNNVIEHQPCTAQKFARQTTYIHPSIHIWMLFVHMYLDTGTRFINCYTHIICANIYIYICICT